MKSLAAVFIEVGEATNSKCLELQVTVSVFFRVFSSPSFALSFAAIFRVRTLCAVYTPGTAAAYSINSSISQFNCYVPRFFSIFFMVCSNKY